MKLLRNKDKVPWEDPNKLKISELQEILSAFGIKYDEGELRTRLFRRYVQLAQVKSPQAVKRWTGQDSIDKCALPAAHRLTVSNLKIFLALHAVDHPAQTTRADLVKLYNILAREIIPHETTIPSKRLAPVPGVRVQIPLHSEHKRRRTSSNPISPANLPSTFDHSANEIAHLKNRAGKNLSKQTILPAFSPYSRQSPHPTAIQKRQKHARTSRSSHGVKLPGPSQPLLQDRTAISTNRRSLSQRSKSKNHSDGEIPRQPAEKPSRSSLRPPLSEISQLSEGGTLLRRSPRLEAAQQDDLASNTTDVLPSSCTSQSTRRSEKYHRDHENYNVGESHIPSSSVTKKPLRQNKKALVSLSSRPVSELSPSPQDGSLPPRSPPLPASQEHDLASCTSEATSLSRPTWRSGKSRIDTHDNNGSEIAISSVETEPPSDTSTRSPAAQEDGSDELASKANHSHSDDDVFHDKISKATRKIEAAESIQRECQYQSKTLRAIFNQVDDHESSSYIPHSPVRETPTLSTSFPNRSILRQPTLQQVAESSIDAASSRESSSAVDSSSTGHSSSTVVPSRQLSKQTGKQPTGRESGCQSVPVEHNPNPSEESTVSSDAQSGSPIPSEASESAYEPSVAPTVESEPSSELTISTRSTRKRRTESPTTTTSKRRLTNRSKAKLSEAKPRAKASRKRGQARKQSVQRKFRLKPAPPSNIDGEDNFCPILPGARCAPPPSSNSQGYVEPEANFSPPTPRTKRRQPEDFSPPAVHSKRQLLPTKNPRSSFARRCERQRSSTRRKITKSRKGKEIARRDSYTTHSTSRDNDVIPLRPVAHLDQLPHPHNSVEQLPHPRNSVDQLPHPCHVSVPDDSSLPRKKRRQPEDFSPPVVRSKRQVLPTRNPRSSFAQRLKRQRQLPARRRSRQSQDRIREKSSTPRPSMLNDLNAESEFNFNRASNVDAWRNSLPPDLEGSSPPPSQNICRVNDTSTARQRDDHPNTNSEQVMLLNQIAQNVQLIAGRAVASNPNLSRKQPNNSCPTGGHRSLSLLARVREHIKALLGQCMELNQFPPPATQSEKAQWRWEVEDESDGESSISNCSDLALGAHGDPAFPYPSGPGHRDLSATALAIMWRSMRRVGVVSFRPDFTQGPRQVDNKFLWNLAHSIFIQLVNAGEYEDIDLETSPEAVIRQTIFNHAKQLQRQYREAGWDPDRLDQRAMKKRRKERTRRLCDHRIKYLARKPGMAALIPVVTQCSSDAETDEEGNDSDVDMDGSNQDSRRMIVQVLPWRHPRVTRAFILIDKLIELKRASGCKDFGRPSHQRIRPLEEIKLSDRAAPSSLPGDCYDGKWLQNQRISLIKSLNIQPGPDLKPMVQKLDDLVRSK